MYLLIYVDNMFITINDKGENDPQQYSKQEIWNVWLRSHKEDSCMKINKILNLQDFASKSKKLWMKVLELFNME